MLQKFKAARTTIGRVIFTNESTIYGASCGRPYQNVETGAIYKCYKTIIPFGAYIIVYLQNNYIAVLTTIYERFLYPIEHKKFEQSRHVNLTVQVETGIKKYIKLTAFEKKLKINFDSSLET